MAKKRKQIIRENKPDNSVATLIVIFLIIIIGGVTLFGMAGNSTSGGGDSGGGAVSGGQEIGALESQVSKLTEEAAKNPENGDKQESLGIALFNLGNAYTSANNPKAQETFTKAIDAFNLALKVNPNSKESWGDLATAYFYTNQTDKAISSVQKALEIDPGYIPALLNYGIYLSNGKGDYEGAIKEWEKVPAGTPEYNQAQSLIQQYKQSK